MQLNNCSRCGKLQTVKTAAALCGECLKAHVAMSQQVKTYLREHPRASLLELCQATGLSLRIVSDIVRQRAWA